MDADGSSLDDASHSALKPDAFDADLFIDMPALGASYVGTMPGGGSSVLEKNLDAIRTSCARTAQLIEQAAPRTDIIFIETDDVCPDSGEPVLSATIGTGDETRALSSKRRPLAEAQKLADGFDIKENGAAAVLGFGLGHHAKAIARVVQKMGVVLCFEPDVALLRAVFERIDHSQWMADTNFAIFTDPADPGLISARLKGFEPTVSLGTRIIHHTPSRPRLGKTAAEFSDNLMRVLRAIRTNLVTTLLQVEVTQRNLLQNLDHYTNAPGITDLKDCCKGKPAIVVSAGPSLARNIHLLKQPGIRERFVIVAAQTVLRQLLAEGIKPHFVTALDYHEISKRFYEGLTEDDVRGVTLIAEAKANPAILDAFPGQIRVPDDKYLTAVLGEDLFTARGQLTPGATVAHLACYVARHMGCDPVILVGQDLGFTDGQYYGAGAAIHRVWSGELNAFNTLEMMEWQRIVRGRATLHKVTDTLGRPVFSDEQMLTYLTQFERDFLADADRGLTVIDATEGGVAKQHTRTMPLADAINKYTPADRLSIPTA
ncbi:motility associated factor glycosyltransferase family protein, partial [Roseiflexus sp. AH-315-K22]|nr:motility associated factor glycosyltransferase family protein [Roseiflexus sp. AH-315-K22]